MTGFTNYEFSMGAKWLEILKEIAPSTVQVSLLLNPDTGSYYVDYLRSVETVALAHSVQTTLAPVHNSDEIESAVAALGRAGGGGLIVLPSAPVTASIQSSKRQPAIEFPPSILSAAMRRRAVLLATGLN